MNRIFRLDQTLDVSPSITVVSKHNTITDMTLLTVDTVLTNYDEAYDMISSSPVADWKNAEGGKNFIDYREGRLQYPVRNFNTLIDTSHQIIQHYHGMDTEFQFGTIDVNVWQQISPRTDDFNIVHTDQRRTGRRSFTCLLFMNRPEECSGGTAFFQHVPTGRYSADDIELGDMLADTPDLYHNGIDYWNQDQTGKVWRMTEYAEMVSNRLIIFPSEYFHTAYHPIDSFYDFSRLTLVFWMS